MTKLGSINSALLILTIGLVLSTAALSLAQSGRRASNAKSPPVPVPTPEVPATPTPTPKPRSVRAVLVGMNDGGGLANFPHSLYTAARESFVQRLREDVSLGVTDGGNMTRGEADKKAKAEKEGYVIYLQLALERFNQSARSEDAREAIVEYIVLAPTTGKVISAGRTYGRTYQNRTIRRPGPRGIYNDYALIEAARAAADEVSEYFKPGKPR